MDPTHIETVGSNHADLLGLEPLGEASVLPRFIPSKPSFDSPPHGFKIQTASEIEVSRFVGPQTDIHGSSQFTGKPEVDFPLRLQTNALTEFCMGLRLAYMDENRSECQSSAGENK